MTNPPLPVSLPNSIKQAAERLAQEDGVSLNDWISSAVAQKVGSVQTAAEFFAARSANAKGTGIMPYLTSAPENQEEAI